MKQYIMSIDQGTTGTTVLILDNNLTVLAKNNIEFPQIYPKPGWVEHDPEAIWKSVIEAIKRSLADSKIDAKAIAGIGITNQRETTVLWDRKDGRPVYNAIVWQCRRTAPLCESLKRDGYEEVFRQKTGLVLDAYFSGTKITWLLDQVSGLRRKAEDGSIAFGTIDSFLVHRLSGGERHVTDVSNASRTLLMNLETVKWDDELLKILKVPKGVLPEIAGNAEVYAKTRDVPGLPDGIPIAGMAGDQQAALFGQACFQPGDGKCTYGTGAFLLINTGKKSTASKNGMLSTVAWKLKDEVFYALEGSTFIAGAAVQWLRDGLQLFKKSSEVEDLARTVEDSGGVYFVPALTGLGAPHWRPNARGLITGLTRGTTKAHIARATLEGIAYQISDLMGAMEKDFGKKVEILRVDGGAAANDLLMQFQADITGRPLVRPTIIETTALGAGFLAGLGTGFWPDLKVIEKAWKEDKRFRPTMVEGRRRELLEGWQIATGKA